jgi:hypothetical protein
MFVAPGIARADPVMGMADDGALVSVPADPGGLLDLAEAHRVRFVRTLVVRGANETPHVVLAKMARARGLGMHAVLAVPWHQSEEDARPTSFASWAARVAARLRATEVGLRLSLLNEPDLSVKASDRCADSVEIGEILASTGLVSSSRRVRVRVKKTKRVRRVVRRKGRRVVVWRRVAVTRVVRKVVRRHGRRVVVRRRVAVWVRRWRRVTVLIPRDGAARSASMQVSSRRGCLQVMRARRAAELLRAAIPAVRAAAPGVPIVLGETSPLPGVEPFLRELGELDIPRADGWAHHPYPVIRGGVQVRSPVGYYGADRIDDYATLVRSLFGRMPLDLSEFGVHRRAADDATSAAVWRRTYARACAVGARSIVAYQWEPSGWWQDWDTSVLTHNRAQTQVSRQLPSLHC